jgi:hypothetical protein
LVAFHLVVKLGLVRVASGAAWRGLGCVRHSLGSTWRGCGCETAAPVARGKPLYSVGEVNILLGGREVEHPFPALDNALQVPLARHPPFALGLMVEGDRLRDVKAPSL